HQSMVDDLLPRHHHPLGRAFNDCAGARVRVEEAVRMSTTLASATELTISFAGQAQPAVDGIDLKIAAGECVALVGESGSGKSLAARALLGLVPSTAKLTGNIQVTGPSGTLADAPARGSRGWSAIRGAQSSLVPQDALGALDPLRRVEHE